MTVRILMSYVLQRSLPTFLSVSPLPCHSPARRWEVVYVYDYESGTGTVAILALDASTLPLRLHGDARGLVA